MGMRIAVVLFNLGGPDRQEAVRPFLFNLFNDPAIIRLPGFVRTPLAWFIAKRRAPKAAEIYQHMGGGSPLLPNTQAQAMALDTALQNSADLPAGSVVKSFIAMRYWHPMTAETVVAVQDWRPDQILLLPLYPQWSTTTTASSFKLWQQMAQQFRLTVPTKLLCCYPRNVGFIAANVKLIRDRYDHAANQGKPRILFSAHGLPKKVVADGDPYQWQCERTAEEIVKALNMPDLDWINCYQSRVGPLEWIGPSTDDEIRRAGADKVPILVVPIAFVSEHSETLVELGIEYRELAHEVGVPYYDPVPTVGTSPDFIAGLADLVALTLKTPKTCLSESHGRICPAQFTGCACAP